MRSRTELVEALINFSEPLEQLMNELRVFGWDSEEELAVLKKEHIISVLNRYLINEVSEIEIRNWANSLECREDIELESSHKNTINEMIFWLANPEINYEINSELANRVINNLEANHVS